MRTIEMTRSLLAIVRRGRHTFLSQFKTSPLDCIERILSTPLQQSTMKVELYNQSIPFEGLASMISDKITEVYVEGVTLTGDEDSAFSLHKKLRGTHPFRRWSMT